MNIYAKSDGETLETHTENCLKVFGSIRKAFPYLPSICGVQEFWKYLFLCLFFHDFGKVATGFQESLLGKRWEYRHEILSAGFLMNLDLPYPNNLAIPMAVLTHHYGSKYLNENYRTYGKIGGQIGKDRLNEKIKEMIPNQAYLEYLIEKLPELSKNYFSEELYLPNGIIEIENCKDAMALCLKRFLNYELEFKNGFYPLFLRGLIIACDHLASSGKETILDGIKETYSKLINEEEIKEIRNFQLKALNLSISGFLTAPTGTGKTSAALLWCQNNQDSGRRIFYVLPYTASINAMQKRLKKVFSEEEVGMIHHKADYFIYKNFLEQDYDPQKSIAMTKAISDTTRKIYRPIKVLTPYQIIKIFYGVKGFESVLSEMAGGLFIFDEIHCYDPRTTALIVKSVEILNSLSAKFLFMSATMPTFLQNLISQAIGRIPIISLDTKDSHENEIIIQARHKIFMIDSDITENIEMIKEYMTENKEKKVLVVCNEVRRAQYVYSILKPNVRKAVLIHGRYITKDRERIESEIFEANLLVGTQAIEVSLNFDFDVIFTEPAPIDALLQRFGRVNRFGKNKEPAPAYIFTKGSEADEYIYYYPRVEKTLEVLPNNEPLSNEKASELVEEIYKDGYSNKEKEEYEWIYKNFSSVVEQLPIFDESDVKHEFFELIKSVEVIPIKFQDEYLQLKAEKKYLDAIGYIVPISLRQYGHLKSQNKIERIDNEIFVNSKYSSELGLIINEPESSTFSSRLV